MWFVSKLLGLLGGNALGQVTSQLQQAYQAKLNAQNDQARLEAEQQISWLETQKAVLVAEQGSWVTRIIRPLLAFPVIVFWWKIIVWDTLLGWGVTPNPGEWVRWYVMMIPGVYFLTRPFGKR